jgi:hypothetical protein
LYNCANYFFSFEAFSFSLRDAALRLAALAWSSTVLARLVSVLSLCTLEGRGGTNNSVGGGWGENDVQG